MTTSGVGPGSMPINMADTAARDTDIRVREASQNSQVPEANKNDGASGDRNNARRDSSDTESRNSSSSNAERQSSSSSQARIDPSFDRAISQRLVGDSNEVRDDRSRENEVRADTSEPQQTANNNDGTRDDVARDIET